MTSDARTAGNYRFTDYHPSAGDGRAALLAGLVASPKTISPKWFYDEAGSQLFDAITRTQEYYPTRTEKQLLINHAAGIADLCGPDCVLIEPGSGSCEKARLLLPAIRPKVFVPVDISADFLQQSARSLAQDMPWLSVHAVCADFNRSWDFTKALPPGRRVIFYPGSTIGNLEPEAACGFLKQVRDVLEPEGAAIIGVDLHKSTPRLNAAYNDTDGVTEAFNRNLIQRVNHELSVSFDPQQFAHRAFYNEDLRRIEMHLEALTAQSQSSEGQTITFESGDTLHTENSYKYAEEDFIALARQAGLQHQHTWIDAEQLFSVHFLRVSS